MNRSGIFFAAGALWLALTGAAQAQVSQIVYFPPQVAVAPAPVFVQQPTFAYRPVFQPQTVFYAPAPVVAQPAPVAVAAPATVVTRYRPLMGGFVTRVRTARPTVTFVTPAPLGYWP